MTQTPGSGPCPPLSLLSSLTSPSPQVGELLRFLLVFHPLPISSSLNLLLAHLTRALSFVPTSVEPSLTFLPLPAQSSPCPSNIPKLLPIDGHLGTCVTWLPFSWMCFSPSAPWRFLTVSVLWSYLPHSAWHRGVLSEGECGEITQWLMCTEHTLVAESNLHVNQVWFTKTKTKPAFLEFII